MSGRVAAGGRRAAAVAPRFPFKGVGGGSQSSLKVKYCGRCEYRDRGRRRALPARRRRAAAQGSPVPRWTWLRGGSGAEAADPPSEGGSHRHPMG